MSEARVALISGASSGIGAATARLLAARGCRVAVGYHRHAEAAQRLAAEIGGLAVALDVRERTQVQEAVATVERELGPVAIVVHNAGLLRDALLPFLPEEDWDAVLDVNLKGAYRLTKAVVKGMLQRRWGRVVSIASVSGVTGQLGQTHYSAAKAGLIAFTKAVAREVAAYGVTANAIAPGFIDTEMLAALPAKRLEDYLRTIPLGRVGRPEEVAALVGYLVSEEAAYMTGQTLRLDGGLIMA
jgi:3-oxoacyl-[acyl-carrier protein] reductase